MFHVLVDLLLYKVCRTTAALLQSSQGNKGHNMCLIYYFTNGPRWCRDDLLNFYRFKCRDLHICGLNGSDNEYAKR